MASFEPVASVTTVLVLRSEVDARALQCCLERGQKEADLSAGAFGDQQISVNRDCRTGMVLERRVPAQPAASMCFILLC